MQAKSHTAEFLKRLKWSKVAPNEETMTPHRGEYAVPDFLGTTWNTSQG